MSHGCGSLFLRVGMMAGVGAACGATGTLAFAQIPLSGEFRVDTSGRAIPLTGPFTNARPRSSAMSRDGEFVVAWTRASSAPLADVLARRFRADGSPVSPEVVVNTHTTGGQYGEAVGMDDDGNFVVVWWGDGPIGRGVFGRRFDAAATPVGAEFVVAGTSYDRQPSIALGASGEFVVVWFTFQGGSSWDIAGRRFDAAGAPAGPVFQVNTYTTGQQYVPNVDMAANGDFVVVWTDLSVGTGRALGQRFSANAIPQGAEFAASTTTGLGFRWWARVARSRSGSFVVVWQVDAGAWADIHGRRFDANGVPMGADFQVNSYTTGAQYHPEVDMDADGDFVVTWTSLDQDGSGPGIFARRFSSSGVAGPEFRVNSYTTGSQVTPTVATDPAGNFVIAWYGQSNVPTGGVFAQRYAGGLWAAGLSVDATTGPGSDGNLVFEPGETVRVAPSWLNADFAAQTFAGTASAFTGPGTSGNPAYTIADAAASYGPVAPGATGICTATGDCYALGISVPATRPALHWDATVREDIAPASTGATKPWTLHVGESFGDVPRSSPFYRFVETLLHHNVTGGCTASTYCPSLDTTREQMAVFVLVAKEGTGYVPPSCGTPVFDDVPASSPFCPWIEELARRAVVTGCGGGNYCPTSAVSREQMAVFVLRALDPVLVPPACGTPFFGDVPASSPFCPWIEELARRGVVTGCGGGNYCPLAAVAREQMGVFLGAGFALALYGP